MPIANNYDREPQTGAEIPRRPKRQRTGSRFGKEPEIDNTTALRHLEPVDDMDDMAAGEQQTRERESRTR